MKKLRFVKNEWLKSSGLSESKVQALGPETAKGNVGSALIISQLH